MKNHLREGCESSKAVASAVWDLLNGLDRSELLWKAGRRGESRVWAAVCGEAEERLEHAGLLTDGDVSPWGYFVLSIADMKREVQ